MRCVVLMLAVVATVAQNKTVKNRIFNLAEEDFNIPDAVVVDGQQVDLDFLENAMFTDFYGWLSKDSNESTIDVQLTLGYTPHDNMQPAIQGWLPLRTYKLTKDAGTHIPVTYHCTDFTGVSRNYSLTLGVEFVGTEYEAQTVTWTKHCWPQKQPGEMDNPISWNTAEIFFFSVFLITLLGCLMGCGFNYILYNKTGADMVPCIDFFRRVCCRRSTNYAPNNMNYERGDDNDEYGAVYQTQL